MREEEGLLVEVLYGQDDGAIEAAPQGLLGAALVGDERFQHGPYHVQLEKENAMGRSGAGTPPRKSFVLHLSLFFSFSFLQMSALKKLCLTEVPV